MKTRFKIATALLLAVAASGLSAAKADFVAGLTVDVVLESDGFHLYTYTLTVAQESTLPAVQFDLAVGEEADLQDVVAPSGWGFDYSAGVPAISFFAESGSAEIAPGSLALFSFRSLVGPRFQEYFLVGVGSGFEVLEGTILAPVVPEPSSLALLSLSAIGSLWVVAKRRSTPRV